MLRCVCWSSELIDDLPSHHVRENHHRENLLHHVRTNHRCENLRHVRMNLRCERTNRFRVNYHRQMNLYCVIR